MDSLRSVPHAGETPLRTWIVPLGSIAVRPRLWWTAVTVVLKLARPGWWRGGRRLPLPDPHYWHFRSLTAFGADGAAPSGPDVVAYLEWCRAWPKVTS